uniref:Prohibitin n=1 Tax=Aegilops tauschii subsp. strangulata TaxID=200361 RepID=A0A453MG11_AEGTS
MRVLPSIIHETLKAVVSQYNASQLITQREAVSREIRKILTVRLRISILLWMVAAHQAEHAKFIVEKAEQDKKKSIIRALVYPEGTHIVIPWLERPIIYDIHARTQPGREHLREPESPDGGNWSSCYMTYARDYQLCTGP